uniref:Uncharacterized protein n=1 Tax=Kalanchoe fedtschenkoi TaxID=63787 RepID=A0A7N0T5X6_KALFE
MREEEDDKAAAELEMEGLREEFRGRSDQDLEGNIRRLRGHVGTLALSDGGEKLKRSIKRIEAEIEWRKRHKEAYVCEKPLQSNAFSAASIDQEIPLSNGKTHSRFFSNFWSKLELSDGRKTKSCNQPKRKPNGLSISQEEPTSRDMPFQCPTSLASSKSDRTPVNTNRMRDISALSQSQRSLPARLMKKAEAPPSINLFQAREKQGNTVVCLDDDDEDADNLREDDNSSSAEEDILFDDMPHQLRNLKECFRGSKISYPSRYVILYISNVLT